MDEQKMNKPMAKLTKKDLDGVSTLSQLLDIEYGKEGTATREDFKEETRSMLVAAKLKELRVRKDITQKEISEKTNVAIAMISRVENQRVNPRLSTFMRIVDALNLSNRQILELMGR